MPAGVAAVTVRRRELLGVDERGSALMLVPAAVLVLLMLGAIAVDSAVVFLAQRDLADRTAAAANDIAAFASSDAAFYATGEIALAADAAERYTALAFPATDVPAGYRTWTARATLDGLRTVRVTASADVTYIFAKALPGFPEAVTVEATSIATARGG